MGTCWEFASVGLSIFFFGRPRPAVCSRINALLNAAVWKIFFRIRRPELLSSFDKLEEKLSFHRVIVISDDALSLLEAIVYIVFR